MQSILTVLILLNSVLAMAQTEHLDPGPLFGPEFTFYDPQMPVGQRPDFLNFLNHARCYVSRCQFGGVKYYVNDDHVVGNGWQFKVKKDIGVLEITTSPMTVSEFERFGVDLQKAIFEMAADAGLYPGLFIGGGHISIDLGYLRDRPKMYRNFLADILINHVELFMGVMGYDTNNALPTPLIAASTLQKLISVFAEFDRWPDPKPADALVLEMDVRRALGGINWEDNYMHFWPHEGVRNARYRSVYFEGSRLELRGVRPQASINVWIRQIRLLRNRMRYLERLDATVPLKPVFKFEGWYSDQSINEFKSLNPPISAMDALENFKIFVEESGENIEDHLDYIWPAWQTDPEYAEFKEKHAVRSCEMMLDQRKQR